MRSLAGLATQHEPVWLAAGAHLSSTNQEHQLNMPAQQQSKAM